MVVDYGLGNRVPFFINVTEETDSYVRGFVSVKSKEYYGYNVYVDRKTYNFFKSFKSVLCSELGFDKLYSTIEIFFNRQPTNAVKLDMFCCKL